MDFKNTLSNLEWINQIAGIVWVLLTGLMLFSLYRTNKLVGSRNRSFYFGIFLIISVWVYPLYTGFYQNLVIGGIGNVFTLIITIMYFFFLRKISSNLSRLMLPQMVWLVLATIYVVIQLANQN